MTVAVLVGDEAAVGLVLEGSLGDAGDDERIETAADDGEHERGHDGGTDFGKESFHELGEVRVVMMRSMALMPMNGTMRPPRP